VAAAIIAGLVGFGWIVFGFFVVVFSVSCLALFTQVLARPGWLLERQLRAGDDVALATGHLADAAGVAGPGDADLAVRARGGGAG
jgi:hypothetical protein